MKIEYRDIKEFKADELKELFLSVGWSSGEYPEKLVVAMRNSAHVRSAWHDGSLVGLMNALSDGAMTAYFHYLLIRPDYQKIGIGTKLVADMLEHYREYPRKVLISYNEQIGFYEKCGFETSRNSTPVFVTSLTT